MTKGFVFMKDFKMEYKRRGLDCLVKDGGRNPGELGSPDYMAKSMI